MDADAAASLPLPAPRLDLGDQQYLMAIYLFIKNYVCGYSGGSNNPVDAGKVEPIDNKIEQAMDLVKSHLLLAVREEVDVLKASIARLMDRIGSLERENDILRGSVAPEVLQQLVDVPPSAPAAAAVQTSPVPPALQQPLAPGPSPAVTTAAATSSQLSGPPGGGAL